jgi:2-polyprenyl-3-methyl-5-hydroxy-6-metoxy-1,4-benzoquinol methylase
VLDVACGAGDAPIAWARRARQEGLALEFHGADRSPLAVAHARSAALARRAPVHFHAADLLAERPLAERYDIVTCSLFLHHLGERDAVATLAVMARAARQLLLVADLRRARAGYMLAWAASRLLTRSNIVHRDAPSSVRAAFREDELAGLAAAAGLDGARVQRAFPQRLLLTWRAS